MKHYSEKQIENYLIREVRIKLKGTAFKFTSPGRRSVPDRLCVVPGYCFFVECKATDKYLTDAQAREARRLRDLNQWVYGVNSKTQIDIIIHFWDNKLGSEGHKLCSL
jgi:hypothetical protein